MHLCRNHIYAPDGGNLMGWVPDRGEHGVKEQGQVILENVVSLGEFSQPKLVNNYPH